MIRIRTRYDENGDQRHGPVLACDVCGQAIEQIERALGKWQNDEVTGLAVSGTLVLLHKGQCDKSHTTAHDAFLWSWIEGEQLLGFLVNASQAQSERHVWPALIRRYCPAEQMEEVYKTAKQIVEYPENRPPGPHEW